MIMKKTGLTVIAFMFIVFAYGQQGKKFEYQLTQFGSYSVSYKMDQYKAEGKHGQALIIDQNYLDNLIFDIIEGTLSKEKLEKIHLGTGFVLTFSAKGEVLNARFVVDVKDKEVITEDELFKIYTSFRNLRFDMDKIKIIDPYNHNNSCSMDYATLLGSMVPAKYRENPK